MILILCFFSCTVDACQRFVIHLLSQFTFFFVFFFSLSYVLYFFSCLLCVVLAFERCVCIGQLTHHQNHGQLNWSIMLLSFYWFAPPVSSIFKLIRNQKRASKTERECDGETELICNQFSIASLFITNKLCFTFFSLSFFLYALSFVSIVDS